MTSAAYWAANKERMQAGNTAWYRAHAEQNRQKMRAYLEGDPERRRRANERSREWRLKNPERVQELERRKKERKPELYRQLKRNNKAKRKGSKGTATPEQIAWRVEMFGWRCWMCKGPWSQIDHVIALARGGMNWPANLRPACATCNNRKNGKHYRYLFLPP